MKKSYYSSPIFGFTIVELLVVIVIIGILAAIALVSYTGISQNARDLTLKSDLNNIARLMQMDQVTNGAYPVTPPSGAKISPGVGISLADTGSTSTFCINGQITNSSQTTYMYYDSINDSVKDGACSGNTISGSEMGTPRNLVVDNSFSNISASGWFLTLQNMAGTTLSKRDGISTDPLPNKPVLVVTNLTSRTQTWAVLCGQVLYGNLTNGSTYKRTYWVRSTGSFTGPGWRIGVIDTNGLNNTLAYGSSYIITSTWQQTTLTTNALRDGSSGNKVYIAIDKPAFVTTGWTLEFQDPQIVLQ